MSWAAHQFEYYAVQGHLPEKWLGRVSFLGIVIGDHSCDFVGKLWSYGIDVGGTHYGPSDPAQWHRGWPGLGFSHSLFWAVSIALVAYVISRNRAWTTGVLLGASMHVLTDVGDSVGVMLAFPFNTQHFTVGAWAYALTPAGRNLDAAAYYSSLGFVTDVVWLLLALTNWRCLSRDYWRTHVVPADRHAWAWLAKWLPERALLALYRSWFIYGLCRLCAWTTWAHAVEDFAWDLSWGGPAWLPRVGAADPPIAITIVGVAVGIALTVAAIDWLLRLPDRYFGA